MRVLALREQKESWPVLNARQSPSHTIEQEQVELGGHSADVIDLMAALKRSLAKNAGQTGNAQPSTRRASTNGASPPDLEGRLKQELYERAQAMNIKGRSGMSKPELAKAIARTSRQSAKSAS